MAQRSWKGTAQPVRQWTRIRFANIEIGDLFDLTINGKRVRIRAASTLAQDLIEDFVEAINNSEDPEFAELTAFGNDGLSPATIHLASNDFEYSLWLLGPENGAPFTISTGTTNAPSFEVAVSTSTSGVAATNEIQTVSLAGPPTGGTFTLTFDGQTTGAIAYNASASTVQTALEALSNIAPGDVLVSGSAGGPWTVEFDGAYAGIDTALMTGNGASLTGAGSISVQTTATGYSSRNEIQVLTIPNASTATGTFRITWDGIAGNALASTATAYEIQQEVNRFWFANPLRTDILVTQIGYGASPSFWIVFGGALAATNVNLGTASNVSGTTAPTITAYQDGTTVDQNEVQVVTVHGGPTGGTFTLTFSGQTTAGIAYNAAAATVQTALEALSNIAPGDVTVTGSAGGPYTVTFGGAYAATDVSLISGSGASLTGGSVTATTTQLAAAGTNEQQIVSLVGGPTGGTFTLTYDGQTTAAIAYNATVGDVDAALEALSNIGAGDVTVTGSTGGPWIVEFTGALAATNVVALTGSASGLTGAGSQTMTSATAQMPTGPHHWDNAGNWSGGAVPVNSDAVIFEASDVSCLYGLDQSAVTLASLTVKASYTGQIGLPRWTGTYYEYREQYLKIGATVVYLGSGEGGGAPLVRLNTGSVQVTGHIYATGNATGDAPAVLWIGTHASSAWTVYKGTFGAAIYDDEVATLATLVIGYRDSREQDASVVVGPGVTLGTVTKQGGQLEAACPIATSLTQTAGETTLRGTGAVAQLTVRGGRVYYETSGTLGGNTVLSGDAVLDFSRDLRTKTVTNPIDVYGDTADVFDPQKSVTSLVVDYNETSRFDGYGSNYRVTRGAVA